MERLPPCWRHLGLHQPAVPAYPRTDAHECLGRAIHVHGPAESGSQVTSYFFIHFQVISMLTVSYYSPVLYRFFHILTPPSELPPLPEGVRSYWPVHGYTVLQIVVTAIIFIVTLTKGAPAFPVIIITLVPIRLLLMNRIWNKHTLKFVDAWACREGTPEDEEDVVTASEKAAAPSSTRKEQEEPVACV